MINILIDKSGKTSKENIFLGNQHENLDETLHFLFPQEYKDYYKYITYSYSNNNQSVTGISPLVDDNFIVSSKITKISGVWELNLICKTSPVDLDDKVIDLTENNSTKEHIFISNTINACVSGNSIDVESFNNVAVDENIANLYDSILALKNRVEENDKAHEQNEEIRKANELERQEAENTRKANENERVNAENARVHAETLRSRAEVARSTAENERDETEQLRVNAENERTNAETERKQAEVARGVEENKRAEAETARQSVETNRVNAENERVSAEILRKQFESARQENEESRKTAETSRVETENLRVSAESARENAEQSRISAESQRVTAEATRESAEHARVEAENARENAEQERVTAENARQEAESRRDSVINKLREDLDANTKADGRTQRSLTALWDLNKGISYRFEEDNEKAYMKTVPSGAKLGAVNKIGGRTIVYNQLFTEEATTVSNGITATYADGIITLNGTATQNWANFSKMTSAMNVVGKFFIKMTIIKNDDNLSFYYGWLNRGIGMQPISSESASVIYNQTDNDLKLESTTGILGFNLGAVFNDVKLQVIIVNLTKMFGEGNEPTTQEFESMFPNSYYPYNEGELMSMSVNEVEEVGKNKFKCEHFSATGLDGTYNPSLRNSYGTSINSTEPSNSVTVTQSKIVQEDIVANYENGYFCVSFKPLTMNGKYVFSFDITPSNKLISRPRFMVLLNGDANQGSDTVDAQSLQVGTKSKLSFNLNVNNKNVKYFEIRNSGVSGIFENFQIEEGSTATSFTPYHENHYAIPQAIQNLDGYGWGVGNIYNYVDYENKKFYKYVNRVDLSTLDFSDFNYGNDKEFHGFINPLLEDMKSNSDAYLTKGNLLCHKYQTFSWNDIYLLGTDKSIALLSTAFVITDSFYSDSTTFNNSLQGVYLYYELAEPIITDISDIIGDTFQEPIDVESGGSLTFKNTNGDGYQVAVPNEVQYVVSLKEVNS